MFRVRIALDRLHCHIQTDPGGTSEPYLWTSFFKGDIETAPLPPGSRLATFTHHESSAGPEFFPGNVQAGDDISVPSAMGQHTFVVDPGELGVAAVGLLVTLLEHDATPEKALRAGHEAFAETVDAELNSFVDSIFPNLRDPTDEEVEDIAKRIQKESIEAIRDELTWYQELFGKHDDFFGHAHQLWRLSDIESIAAKTPPEESVPPKRIHHEKHVFDPATQETIVLVNEYELFGRVRVERISPLPDHCQDELAVYEAAAKRLKDIDQAIATTQEELSTAPPSEKPGLIAEIKRLQEERAEALEAVGLAREAYEKCRGGIVFGPGPGTGPVLEANSIRRDRRRRRLERRQLRRQ